MAEYRVTGVWKNLGIITHYAVHLRTKNTEGGHLIYPAKKMTKADAILLLEKSDNSAKTLIWNYNSATWDTGEDIHVVGANPKYLRTNHDNKVKDNLLHLIDYGYVY